MGNVSQMLIAVRPGDAATAERPLLDGHRPGHEEDDLRGGKRRHPCPQCRSDALRVRTQQHPKPGTSASFSPDGTRLAVDNSDSQIGLRDSTLRLSSKKLNSAASQARIVFSLPSNVPAATAGRAPSFEKVTAAKAKKPPSSNFGGQGQAESKQP